MELRPRDGGAGSRPAGTPLGRRLFLGLLGAGAAGLWLTRWSFRADDAVDASNVATAVPLGADGEPVQRETSEGQHPNVVVDDQRFRYYSVGTVPDFDERTWRLLVDGEGADGRLRLRHGDVTAFDHHALRATFRCVTGWRVRDNVWLGVRLRDVIAAASPNALARFVTLYSMDGVYTESLTIEQARSDHTLLVWELNGTPLIREQGFPLRVIYPDMYGYKNIKWLTRIELKSRRDLGFWEANDGWEIDGYVYNPDPVHG